MLSTPKRASASVGRFDTLAAALATITLLVSCGSSSNAGSGEAAPTCTEGAPGCVGWRDCPAGFEKDMPTADAPEAAGCHDIQAEADCAPGTMPVLGSRDCQPVGATACPAGFAKAASGWGCAEVLPAAACTGATREELGSSTCVPVGDCSAPFPPASATLFVNDAYTAGRIDATHFRTINAALSVAPAGAVIAVDTGIYTEGLGPSRAVTIVGRCAEKVWIDGRGLQYPGVFSRGVKGIVASGMTLQGNFQGVRAEGGGTITVSDVVIESPRLSGIIAYQPGSVVTASRVVVRAAHGETAAAVGAGATADAGGKLDLTDVVLASSADVGLSATNATAESKTPSTITARRTVIRETRPSKKAPAGSGLAAFDGCAIDFEGGVVMSTYGIGVLVEIGGAKATLKSSVIRDTRLSPDDGIGGGVLAYDESSVTLDSVTVTDNDQAGVYARGRAALAITGSVIQGSKPQGDGDFGMGLWADQGAKVELATSAVVDNAYYGIAALDPGTDVHASGSIVRGTKRTPAGAASKGDVLGRGINVESGALARLEDVSFVANGDTSVFVRGGVKGTARSHVVASRLIVRDTTSRMDGSTGDGVAVQGGALLELDTAAVVRARRAGILVNDVLGPDGDPAEASVTHTIVRDTQAAGDGLGTDAGIALEGVGIASGGKLMLTSSAVLGNVEFGVVLGGKNSSGTVESTIIRNTAPQASGAYGHGLVGVDGSTVLVKGSIILANRIGAAFESATATLTGVLVQQNAIGIHVQGDSQLVSTAVAPADPSGDVVTVTDDSRFVDNQSRVGSGLVPLPKGPISAPDPAPKAPTKTK